MRILGVDPGDKRIGIAISDPSGTIANPLSVIQHLSREIDAGKIIGLAEENEAKLIIVGQSLELDGKPSYQGRKSVRLARAMEQRSELSIILWDESHSTQQAREARAKLGSSRKKRAGHLDDLAATVILQSYLDAQIEAQA